MITPTNETYGNLRDILNVVFKHKIKISSIFLSVVVVVTVITLNISPTYEASSKILVKFGRENVYTPTNSAAEGRVPTFFDSSKEGRINSEVEILKGRNLIEKVINDLGVNTLYPEIDKKTLITRPVSKGLTSLEKAILTCEKNLSVGAIKDSSIISIKFQHKDRLIAAQFLNKLVSVFLEHHLNVYKNPAKYNFFNDQVSLQKKALLDSEKMLETFKQQNSISSLARQKELLLEQISGLEIALSNTNSEISRNEGELKSLKGSSSDASTGTVMGKETDELNPHAISSIRTRLSEMRLEEQALLSNYTEQSMRVRHIRQEIEKAQKLLAKEEQNYHDKAITSIGHNLKALKNEAATQKKQLVVYQQRLNNGNSKERKLKELGRQFEMDEKKYQQYVKHMEDARISKAMDTQMIANISVVEPALPPLKPVKPNKGLNVILSIFLGVFAGFGAAFFFEFSNNTFNNNEDINKYLGLPVFASIPEPQPHIPMDFMSRHVSKEYQGLKQHLISSAADEKMKTILFFSSAKEEGNSTVLSNFATALASRGDNVLLVDTNLRKPCLHDLFKLDKKDGLTELLLEEKSLDDVIKQTRIENLSVITSGVSHTTLESQSLDSFIEQVKPFFDWILFDCPSVHACNDARMLAEKMDGVVMVAQAESTRWEVAQRAKGIIENEKIKVLGVVLNRRKWHIPGWIYKRL